MLINSADHAGREKRTPQSRKRTHRNVPSQTPQAQVTVVRHAVHTVAAAKQADDHIVPTQTLIPADTCRLAATHPEIELHQDRYDPHPFPVCDLLENSRNAQSGVRTTVELPDATAKQT